MVRETTTKFPAANSQPGEHSVTYDYTFRRVSAYCTGCEWKIAGETIPTVVNAAEAHVVEARKDG